MKEILGPIDRWLREGSAVALARVVDVEGSGPRAPGAAMAVDERGEVVGSVSGGCVEGAVVTEAQAIGYRVTVCDARKVFATRARFPLVDELVVEWPDRLLDRIGPGLTPRDAVCVLTHDVKFDVPALVAALRTDAGYIGAMGSRRTHAERARRMREAGVDDQGLARIRSPIGLDLGGRTPEETAVSICAEIIADRTGRRDVRPLSETEGPIHRGHQGDQ